MAKIVVVDDEPDWLNLCREYLQEHGHKVLTASNWLRALRLIWFRKPDLVVLDVEMSGGGSFLLGILKKYWPHMPVIMHSVYSHYKADPRLSCADAFVVKCVDCSALIKEVDILLATCKESI